MAARPRVLNLTTKCYLKIRQAEGRIEQCVSEWVVKGSTIRDLSLAQMVYRRSQQARLREPLAPAEIAGLTVTGIPNLYQEERLAIEANKFSLANA